MPSKAPVKPLSERTLDAETRASQWLADGNEARQFAKAERCFEKSQYWLDRANQLSGRGERPAPSQ